MEPPLTEETKSFWNFVHNRKKNFPFWCKTRVGNPVPELVETRHFIQLPHGVYSYWGFRQREQRDIFSRKYNAQEWQP